MSNFNFGFPIAGFSCTGSPSRSVAFRDTGASLGSLRVTTPLEQWTNGFNSPLLTDKPLNFDLSTMTDRNTGNTMTPYSQAMPAASLEKMHAPHLSEPKVHMPAAAKAHDHVFAEMRQDRIERLRAAEQAKKSAEPEICEPPPPSAEKGVCDEKDVKSPLVEGSLDQDNVNPLKESVQQMTLNDGSGGDTKSQAASDTEKAVATSILSEITVNHQAHAAAAEKTTAEMMAKGQGFLKAHAGGLAGSMYSLGTAVVVGTAAGELMPTSEAQATEPCSIPALQDSAMQGGVIGAVAALPSCIASAGPAAAAGAGTCGPPCAGAAAVLHVCTCAAAGGATGAAAGMVDQAITCQMHANQEKEPAQ